MNKAIICGNLGRDPESRQTKSGTAVTNLRVATTHRVKRNDTWEDQTEWHRVVTFGKTAENCAKFLEKGRKVLIEGRIQTSSYEKDGEKRYSTEIVADTVQFLGGAKGAGSQTGKGSDAAYAPYDPGDFGPAPGNDDLPF